MANTAQLEAPEQHNLVETIAALATIGQDPKTVGGGTPFVLHDGKVVSLRDYLPRTPYIHQTVRLETADDFIDYIREEAARDDVRIFYTHAASSFRAFLDWHDEEPNWCRNTATYTMPHSPEWVTWAVQNNGKGKKQTDFAEFVESNLPDIVEPDGAKLLDMVKTMQAKKDVQFESSVRLDNGAVQFRYHEDIRGTVTQGAIDIPTEFAIGIAPFIAAPPFRIQARLRWRISEQKQLVLWYDLVRPHKVLETVTDELIAKIAADTGCKVWRGIGP